MISGLTSSLCRKRRNIRSGCAAWASPRPNISNMTIEAIIMTGRCTATINDSTSKPCGP